MIDKVIEVEEIPKSPQVGATFLIRGNGISNYTHGFFKYPCKYIPHVPRWFLNEYGDSKTKKHGVLDPFVGSGTTLVESSLLGYPSYGIDIDPLSCLLSKVKTTKFSKGDIELLKSIAEEFKIRLEKNAISESTVSRYKPNYTMLDYWFSQDAINNLSKIKYHIDYFYKKTNSKRIRNFLMIVFASIIRRASLAEEQSPKPYISKKIKKRVIKADKLFISVLDKYIKALTDFSDSTKLSSAKLIGYEARNINKNSIRNGQVHLAMTSPPYINAFDYVRSLKLENIWLDLVEENKLSDFYDKQVGTEKISSDRYNENYPATGYLSLDKKLREIYKIDKKRSYVVADFFESMKSNLGEIRKILIPGGFYCIVVGDSRIRNVEIPTSQYLIDIAKSLNYKLINNFSYIIRNRYLRIPRKGRGGFIPKDYIIVLKK
ncbi:MAG: modification methylase [Actinomycetota bacterium]|nr:modification methylase [Actinomycetota bacterium]